MRPTEILRQESPHLTDARDRGKGVALFEIAMDEETEFILSEIPDVADIVRQECRLEGERRGSPVDPSDVSVQQRVAEIILDGEGQRIRDLRRRRKADESIREN